VSQTNSMGVKISHRKGATSGRNGSAQCNVQRECGIGRVQKRLNRPSCRLGWCVRCMAERMVLIDDRAHWRHMANTVERLRAASTSPLSVTTQACRRGLFPNHFEKSFCLRKCTYNDFYFCSKSVKQLSYCVTDGPQTRDMSDLTV